MNICLIGPHNSGKSSFLNAIASELIVCSELYACTRSPTQWIFNSKESYDDIDEYISEPVQRNNKIGDMVIKYARSHLINRLFTIVDLPGMSQDTTNIKNVKSYIHKANLVIYIIDINTASIHNEVSAYMQAITAYISYLRIYGKYIKFIVLYNKCDDGPHMHVCDLIKDTYRLSSHLLLCEGMVRYESHAVTQDKFKSICNRTGYKLINDTVVGYGFCDYNKLLVYLNTVEFDKKRCNFALTTLLMYKYKNKPGRLHALVKTVTGIIQHIHTRVCIKWVQQQYTTVDGILRHYFVYIICLHDNSVIDTFKKLMYDHIEMVSYMITGEFDFVNMMRSTTYKINLNSKRYVAISHWILNIYGRCGSVADWILSIKDPSDKMKSMQVLLRISNVSVKRLIKTDQLNPGCYESAFDYIPHLYENFIEKIYSGNYKRLSYDIFKCKKWDSDNAPFYFI